MQCEVQKESTHFAGVTGNVTINKNGDRLADYILLDMDSQGDFKVSGSNSYDQFRPTTVLYLGGGGLRWPHELI